jgi:hypothetical protein
MNPKILLALLPFAAACSRTPAPRGPAQSPTKNDVEQAQQAWCDALVGISAAKLAGQDPRPLAEAALDKAYFYQEHPVLFKPTLTVGEQTFRFDREGALAYFVGGNPKYKDDSGFALKDWTTCRPEVRNVVASGDMILAMGNVYLTDAHGKSIYVDKTFGYLRDSTGALRIVLHHSSLPYTPEAGK